MIINEIKFISHTEKVFRKLEKNIEKSFLKVRKIKTADEFVNIYTEILTAILSAEDETVNPILEQSSREAMAEIFKTETNTCKTV
jgi:hypothetical protein